METVQSFRALLDMRRVACTGPARHVVLGYPLVRDSVSGGGVGASLQAVGKDGEEMRAPGCH